MSLELSVVIQQEIKEIKERAEEDFKREVRETLMTIGKLQSAKKKVINDYDRQIGEQQVRLRSLKYEEPVLDLGQ